MHILFFTSAVFFHRQQQTPDPSQDVPTKPPFPPGGLLFIKPRRQTFAFQTFLLLLTDVENYRRLGGSLLAADAKAAIFALPLAAAGAGTLVRYI